MVVSPKRFIQWAICSLVLICLLSACDLFGGSTSATSTPTTAPAAKQPTVPTQANFATYTGDSYTIQYPQGWSVKKSTGNVVTFTDPQGIAYLYVKVTPNPGGIASSQDQVSIGLDLFKSQVKSFKKGQIASTTSIAGDTWNQGTATGDLVPTGQTTSVTVKAVVVADNHPANAANTMSFIIGYVTAEQVFDLADQGDFQPMLRSFRFA